MQYFKTSVFPNDQSTVFLMGIPTTEDFFTIDKTTGFLMGIPITEEFPYNWQIGGISISKANCFYDGNSNNRGFFYNRQNNCFI